MKNEIQQYLGTLEFEQPQFHKNMAVVSLMNPDSNLEYLVFDEAVNKGLAVEETSSVQELKINNKTGKEVLIMQGEFVLGGKQNRMISRNIYMEKNFTGSVPVNCVQQHRWSPTFDKKFSSSKRMATKGVKLAASRSQGEVWNSVACFMAQSGSHSQSHDLGEIFSQKERDVSDYLSAFSLVDGAVGVAIATRMNGDIVYGIDLFDKHATMNKNFKKIIESSAMEAIVGEGEIAAADIDVEEFLDSAKNAIYRKQKSVSLGKDYLISGNVEGGALSFNRIPVYVTFASGHQRNATRHSDLGRRRPDIHVGGDDDQDTINPSTGFGRVRFGDNYIHRVRFGDNYIHPRQDNDLHRYIPPRQEDDFYRQ